MKPCWRVAALPGGRKFVAVLEDSRGQEVARTRPFSRARDAGRTVQRVLAVAVLAREVRPQETFSIERALRDFKSGRKDSPERGLMGGLIRPVR